MITVNKFQVSSDMKTLNIIITAAAGKRINKLTLQTEETYEDSSVNLTSKLLGTSEVENITLAPSDLSISSFNGIYFATIETNEVGVAPVTVSACNVSQFFYAMNDQLTSVDAECISCNDTLNDALLMDLYLEGLKNCLMTGRNIEAIVNFYSIRRLCTGRLDNCATGCTSGYGILDGSFVLA